MEMMLMLMLMDIGHGDGDGSSVRHEATATSQRMGPKGRMRCGVWAQRGEAASNPQETKGIERVAWDRGDGQRVDLFTTTEHRQAWNKTSTHHSPVSSILLPPVCRSELKLTA